MKEQWALSKCSKEGAYAQGMNDGRDGKKMSNDAINQMCPIEKIPMALQGYREGYQAGMQANQQPAGAQTVNYGTVINVEGQGPQSHLDRKAWFCEVQAFENHYQAYGPTEMEAKQNVIRECTMKNHPMHCEDTACRRNN